MHLHCSSFLVTSLDFDEKQTNSGHRNEFKDFTVDLYNSSNSIEVDQNEMFTTEIEELRKKTQMANITINDQNAMIQELIGNNSEQGSIISELEENAILLKDELEEKNAQIAQLEAHLSFLTLDQQCS